MKRRFLMTATVLGGLLTSQAAWADHFRGGTISWVVPDPVNAPTTVEFTETTGWGPLAPSNVAINYGDGASASSLTTTDIGTQTDTLGIAYSVLQAKTTHVYASATSYLAFHASGNRILPLVNGGNGPYRLEALVDLTGGNTGGPVTLAPLDIQLAKGGVRSYIFPAADPDGDPITCRFASDAEVGFTGAVPIETMSLTTPTIAADPAGCMLSWDLTGAVSGKLYSLQIAMESVHGNATSKVVLDMVVEITQRPPPACAGSGSFTLHPGQAFSTPLTGTAAMAGDLTVSDTNGPAASTLLPASGPSPLTSTFTWTPTAADVGPPKIVVVNYQDAFNLTGSCFLKLDVQACAPTSEVCDGKDNDCDGVVDNGLGVGAACQSGLPGPCSTGLNACAPDGSVACVPEIAPNLHADTCNGVDDDCDGMTDEGFDVGGACTNGLGACEAAGVIACDPLGGAACDAIPGAQQPEICDNIDNDCNGLVDDGTTDSAVLCESTLPGTCKTGSTVCAAGGTLECLALFQPGQVTEICNGVDDDCDGMTDEGFNVGGACTSGLGECQATGAMVCDSEGGATCDAVPGAPKPEICGDALDSDCDGSNDNGCPDTDGDGIFDPVEVTNGTDPMDPDTDDDGVTDGAELLWNTDSDGDGKINALDPDSDDDGLFDGTEMGKDCKGPGTNAAAGVCTPDADLGATGTSPINADTDAGGLSDGIEDRNKNGQIDEGDLDPNAAADDDVACSEDSQCGGPTSARVCSGWACIDGCRGKSGNTCSEEGQCTSTDETVGACLVVEGNGACSASPANENGSSSALVVGLGLTALLGSRRRRRRA